MTVLFKMNIITDIKYETTLLRHSDIDTWTGFIRY